MNKLIELHLHLDGSLRPETVWDIANKDHIEIPAKSLEEVRFMMEVPEDCRSLNEYLERFELPLKVLQKAEHIERVSFELVEDLAKEGIGYAEIRYAPLQSIREGLTQDEVTEASIRGVKKAMNKYPGIRAGIILCCMRGNDIEELNMQTIETAAKYLGDTVCAVDLAGAEALFPTENFEKLFARADKLGIPFTIHAGEAAGVDSMKCAVKFGARRIGHGVAAIKDEAFIKELIEKNICLEVCVKSNYQTKVVRSIREHPIHKLFSKGVRVTVNSDNRTCSKTSLSNEINILKSSLGFSDEEIDKMKEYAWEARFLK